MTSLVVRRARPSPSLFRDARPRAIPLQYINEATPSFFTESKTQRMAQKSVTNSLPRSSTDSPRPGPAHGQPELRDVSQDSNTHPSNKKDPSSTNTPNQHDSYTDTPNIQHNDQESPNNPSYHPSNPGSNTAEIPASPPTERLKSQGPSDKLNASRDSPLIEGLTPDTNEKHQKQPDPLAYAEKNYAMFPNSSLESLDLASVSSSAHRVNPIHDDDLEINSIHDGDLENMSKPVSKHRSTDLKEVPRSERRGLLPQLVFIPEIRDARDYSNTKKYFIVVVIAFALITGPMGSSIIMPAIDDIVSNLHSSVLLVNVCVGVYLLLMGIFPLWWSALSELYGRRTVYFVSFVLFFVFSVGCAVSPNIGGLIALRVLQGGCSALVQALGAGTIADLFRPEERGTAMGYYYLGPLCGPFFAPILGGVVSQVWGWRATQWLLVILAGINCMLIIFGLPETLRKTDNLAALRDMLAVQAQQSDDKEENAMTEAQLDRVASNLSRRSLLHELEEELVLDHANPSLLRINTNRTSYSRRVAHEILEVEMRKTLSQQQLQATVKPTAWNRFKEVGFKTVIKPIKAVQLLAHPPILLVVIYSSICFGTIYFFNLTITYEYSREPYHFKTIIVGLLYIPNSVTYVIALMIGGKWNDRLVHKYAEQHNGEFRPEARFSWNLVLAVACYMPACLVFGWPLKYGVFWVVPLVGTAFSGFALMLVIGATTTYLVDSLPGKGATGIALNNLCRQIVAAIATFIVEPLLRAIGPGILFSIIAGLLLFGSSTILILKRKGLYFREHYDLAALYEKL